MLPGFPAQMELTDISEIIGRYLRFLEVILGCWWRNFEEKRALRRPARGWGERSGVRGRR
jgi:hypothetical protein